MVPRVQTGAKDLMSCSVKRTGALLKLTEAFQQLLTRKCQTCPRYTLSDEVCFHFELLIRKQESGASTQAKQYPLAFLATS